MGVALLRQVQVCVRRVEVGFSPPPVRHAGDLQLTDDAGERPLVALLDRAAGHAGLVDDDVPAHFVRRPQVEVVLEEKAQQLPALRRDVALELGVGEGAGCASAEEAADHLELGDRGLEGPVRGSLSRSGHRGQRAGRAARSATSSARPALAWSSRRALAAW